jgi:hypothetical protein
VINAGHDVGELEIGDVVDEEIVLPCGRTRAHSVRRWIELHDLFRDVVNAIGRNAPS